MEDTLPRGSMAMRGGFALALAVLADRLTYGDPLGLGTALVGAALVLGLLATRVRTRLEPRTRAAALATLGLCVAWAVDPGPLVFLMYGIGVATVSLWLTGGADTEVAQWLGRLGAFGCGAWRAPSRGLRPLGYIARQVRFAGVAGAAANWWLPVGLSLVFVSLFCQANPVLARGIAAVEQVAGRALEALFAGRDLDRWMFGALVAAAAVACMRFRTRGWFAGVEDASLSFSPDLLATETVVRCLVLFNAVFALQTVVDLGVIATGGGLPAGMTFAEYAHRGAYPLIATSLLAGLFVTLTFSSGQKAAEQRGARALVLGWIAQNVVLLASTVYRHTLYVDAYGLTCWRLATIVWLGLVAAGFVLTAQRIVTGRSNGWLLRWNVGVTVAVLYASCFVNWGGLIAGYNAAHCAERGGHGPSLDIPYLIRLGPAALPALEAHRAALAGRCDPVNLSAVETGIDILRRRVNRARTDWRTWTLRSMLVSGAPRGAGGSR